MRAQQAGEALAVLGEVDGVERRAEDPVAGVLDRARELERRLAAELDHDAVGPLALADREHRLGVERLEVEPVGRVVVGRDGLGVAVDHHRLVAELAVRRDGVDAAVVELDALPDPVRAGAEDRRRAAGRRSAGPRPSRPRSSSSSSRPPRPRRRTSRRGGTRAGRRSRAAAAAPRSRVVPAATAMSASESPSRFRRSQSPATSDSTSPMPVERGADLVELPLEERVDVLRDLRRARATASQRRRRARASGTP